MASPMDMVVEALARGLHALHENRPSISFTRKARLQRYMQACSAIFDAQQVVATAMGEQQAWLVVLARYSAVTTSLGSELLPLAERVLNYGARSPDAEFRRDMQLVRALLLKCNVVNNQKASVSEADRQVLIDLAVRLNNVVVHTTDKTEKGR